jgi:hypothetical protein
MNTLLLRLCCLIFIAFTLGACGSEEDACLTLACLNDGTCVGGACACPEGFEGDDCSIQQTPVSMSVVGINVTKYPTVRTDSSSWDSLDNSGPDIFFAFHEGTGSAYDPAIDLVSTMQNNATGAVFEVDVAPPYIVTNLAGNWSLDLWDADAAGQEEYMESVIVNPLNESVGLPTSFTIQKPAIAVTFFVQWDF